MSDAGKELVRSFFAALSTGDLDRVASFFDADSTWTVCAKELLGAGTTRGPSIVEEFLRPVRGLFEPGDPKVHVDALVAEGDLVVAEARGSGRFANGLPYDNQYVFVFELDGGTIRAIREYMDTQYAARVTAEATAGSGA